MIYAVIQIYDPGAGDYSEETLSLHYNRQTAEDKATSLLIRSEEEHLAASARLERSGYKLPDYPQKVEFYGRGGGRWGDSRWEVREMEVED